MNSLQLVGNDRFLVSMRNTWSTYMVNVNTGQIQWILGGKRSNFKLGPGADFQWQHDVRLQGNSTISMFDDHCCQITGGGTYVSPTGPSRGLVLKLDQATRTATVDAQYSHGSGFDADYMGDTQPLHNGNVFVGWGSQPNLSEYSSSGQLLMDAAFPGPDLTYRATLNHWVGLPLDPPVGAAQEKNGKVDRLRQLERLHPGRGVGGSGRIKRQLAHARGGLREVGIRDLDPGAPELPGLRGRRAGRAGPRDRGLQAVQRLEVTARPRREE